MDRLLLESNWNRGYPLCLETLQLLNDNVQLLETVLNGLGLPARTIVRFPYGDYAYVQNVAPESGRGEILKIVVGANLANDEVRSYSINSEDVSITDSNENDYEGAYQKRSLSLSSTPVYGLIISVINFSELFEKALWESVELVTSGPYRGRVEIDYSGYIDDSSVIDVKINDRELRIRICLNVNSLPIAGDSELRIVFNGNYFDDIPDVVPVWSSFNSTNNNLINKHVGVDVCRKTSGCFMVKIFTHELYAQGSVTSFTGQITVNAVIALTPSPSQSGGGGVTQGYGNGVLHP